MEDYKMPTDKQYDGMLKDQIASYDRVAKRTKDKDALSALLEERNLAVSKLGYEVPDNGLYEIVQEK